MTKDLAPVDPLAKPLCGRCYHPRTDHKSFPHGKRGGCTLTFCLCPLYKSMLADEATPHP